ncbi:TnsD family Tn7-like transposition protein, partial [Psychrosphaera sp.]|nr:TnsD family Tn7-like transposition protein [Psychrosphaera sp.]
IALLLQTDCSLREISRRVKRSVIFVKTIASQIGAYFQRRTQFITPDIIFRVTESAQIGEHRKQIAKRESISVGAVEQIIQSVPGLPEKRKLIRFEQRRSVARASIENAIESSPSITRGKIKNACGANYTWLYKHDSEWLYKTLPKALNYTKK